MLIHWSSKMLRQYGQGHIIVSAQTIPEARERARMNFEKYLKERFDWMFVEGRVETDYDEWEREQMEELRKLFEADIAVEPKVDFEICCLFINGSE